MTKPKFTFKNYLGELKKSWLLLAIFLAIGAVLGACYTFSRPTNYTASAKLLINNSYIDNGSTASPYAQIGELLSSKKLLEAVDPSLKDIPSYEVKEAPRGVFEITVTDKNADHAKEIANAVSDKADEILAEAFDAASDYRITVIEVAEDATPTTTNKARILSIAIAALGMLVIGAVIVFIKFDYHSEK
jgi:capsular polysaccharide biosynthesis protein